MSSLKICISSSVYVTIDPGISSVVASPSCLVELSLAIFCATFTGYDFFCFLVVANERGFFMPLQELVVQLKARDNLRLTLKKRRKMTL